MKNHSAKMRFFGFLTIFIFSIVVVSSAMNVSSGTCTNFLGKTHVVGNPDQYRASPLSELPDDLSLPQMTVLVKTPVSDEAYCCEPATATDQQIIALLSREAAASSICEPFAVSVDLRGFSKMTSDVLLYLAHRYVYKHLVWRIDLSNACNIDDDGLLWLSLSGIPLESLCCSGCTKITNRGLFFLSKIKTLRSINLSCCPNITNRGVSFLRDLPALSKLALDGCPLVTDVKEALNNRVVKEIKIDQLLTQVALDEWLFPSAIAVIHVVY